MPDLGVAVNVLLVEDDSLLVESLRRGLSAEGFMVTSTGRGDEGLWLVREGTFDVVVLDVMLPGLDGLSVCREIRAADPNVPVLVLTALDGEEDQTRALGLGADDYLAKPFSFRVLVARLHALLRRAGQGAAVPLRLGALTVEPRSRRVEVDGSAVAVTAREFDLLQFLVRRPGTVVSKSTILDGVWGFDFAGEPNIVEVYVRRLRRKLGPDVRIDTVRGAGYRLADDA